MHWRMLKLWLRPVARAQRGDFLRRLSFEELSEVFKKKKYTRTQSHQAILDMVASGHLNGNDKVGYLLTNKGVFEAERHLYGRIGVV